MKFRKELQEASTLLHSAEASANTAIAQIKQAKEFIEGFLEANPVEVEPKTDPDIASCQYCRCLSPVPEIVHAYSKVSVRCPACGVVGPMSDEVNEAKKRWNLIQHFVRRGSHQ